MHVTDGINVGAAGTPADAGATGRPPLVAGSGSTPYQPGTAISPTYMFDIAPLTSYSNNLATAAVVSGGSFTLAAGTGITSSSLYNRTVYALDVARCIKATGAGASTAATLITLTGYDEYGQYMTQTFTGPTGTAATTTTKAFKYIYTAAAAGNTVSGVALGTADVFGLPKRVDQWGYVVSPTWAGANITASTNFVAAVTTTATATTGDVRGTYATSSASDGTKRLTALIYTKDPSTMAGVYGVTQA